MLRHLEKYVNAYSGETQNLKVLEMKLMKYWDHLKKISTFNTIAENGSTWNAQKQREQQITMLKELMKETKMVTNLVLLIWKQNIIELVRRTRDKKFRFNTWNSGRGDYDIGSTSKYCSRYRISKWLSYLIWFRTCSKTWSTN